jgi:hypothetical protein
MVGRPPLEQLAAPPVRTDSEAVGIEPVLFLVTQLGLIVDSAIQTVEGGDVNDERFSAGYLVSLSATSCRSRECVAAPRDAPERDR